MTTPKTTTAPAAPATTPPSSPATKAGLASLLNQRRAAQSSRATPAAASPVADETPAGNGSVASQPAASRQPAAGQERRRTDEANLSQDRGTPAAAASTVTSPDAADPGVEGDANPADAQDTGEESGPKQSPRVERRINKLIGTIKALEAENARLKGGAAQPGAAQAQGAPAAVNPDHPELARIERDLARNEAVFRWVQKNPEGGEIEIDGKRHQVTAEEARDLAAALPGQVGSLSARKEVLLADLRADFEAQQEEARTVAEAHYPWMTNAEAPEFQEAVSLLQALPPRVTEALRSLPDSRLLLADLVAGRRARLTPRATPQAARPAARPTPQPAAASAAASRLPDSRRTVVDAREKFVSSGRSSDLKQMLAARRRAAREVAA